MNESLTSVTTGRPTQATAGMDEVGLSDIVARVLNRWPSAGLAVGVIRGGSLAWFHGQGVAEISSGQSVTADSVFRIGSVTKTFTAIAVMQLWEQGLLDLDAPANEYLHSFRLLPVRAGIGPPTVRHLLTHTAGIGYWRRFSDLLRPGVGSGVRAGRSESSLPDYYRRGLPVEVQPGSKWVYSNHGFAALGQLVQDVTGQPLDRYLREFVFGPVGMANTDLVRSERVRAQLATGYVLRSRGLRPVVDRAVPAVGGGAAYSTVADMSRYVAALLNHGDTWHGQLVRPETLASMFQPHFQPDRRIPGMGLGFLLGEEDGHRTVGHDGIVSGFLSHMTMAPDDGIGVVVLGNTGGLDGRGAPEPLGTALLRRQLGLPAESIRTDIPARPETWAAICGWYAPDPGPVTNLFTRAVMGAGAEVTVRGGHLMLRPLTPVPAIRRGMRLNPDDPDDPYVFRVDFSGLGKGTLRVAFSGCDARSARHRLMMNGMCLRRRPDVRNPRLLLTEALSVGTAVLAQRQLRRHIRRG